MRTVVNYGQISQNTDYSVDEAEIIVPLNVIIVKGAFTHR